MKDVRERGYVYCLDLGYGKHVKGKYYVLKTVFLVVFLCDW